MVLLFYILIYYHAFIKCERRNMIDEDIHNNQRRSAGRPSNKDQHEIIETLKKFYEKGIGIKATAKETGYNYKTVRRYFRKWDKQLLQNDDCDFIKRCRVEKERIINALDHEILECDKKEQEYNAVAQQYLKSEGFAEYEKASKLYWKAKTQKNQLMAQKINLVNTPLVDTIRELQKGDKNN